MPGSMPAPMSGPMPAPMHAAMPADHDAADRPMPRGWRLGLLLKKMLIAGSVAAIIVGGALLVMDMLSSDAPPIPTFDLPDTLEVPKNAPSNAPRGAPGTTPAPSRPMPSPQGSLMVPSGADPEATGQIGGIPSMFDPATMLSSRQQNGDVTGSVQRKNPPAPRAPGANGPTGNAGVDALPPSISPVMRHALASSDPAAEYELGLRYAEGRGLTQSTPEAVRWLQRSADAGFAPAQFRLAGMNEKGDGIKKDVQTARRLYLAAAGKGHAKAMHNLAVLYAEGGDGKPDYKAASEWFRKAASYGVTDSQYNLAILFARGIGVQANLAESYRWFALAAAGGDTEAAKKRDEVAARLDQKTLAAAKAAAQSFGAEREPDEATNLRAPPGGWDKAPAAQAKPKR
jgi:localization factor PodJL